MALKVRADEDRPKDATRRYRANRKGDLALVRRFTCRSVPKERRRVSTDGRGTQGRHRVLHVGNPHVVDARREQPDGNRRDAQGTRGDDRPDGARLRLCQESSGRHCRQEIGRQPSGAGFVVEREVWPVEHKGIDEPSWREWAPDVLTGDEVDRSLADDLVASGAVTSDAAKEKDSRPEIVLSTDEHVVNAQSLSALASDPHVFCRGGVLVKVVTDDSTRIHELSPALIRESLAANCKFIQMVTKRGKAQIVDAHPPAHAVNALHNRGEYPGVRKLVGVVPFPVVRPDGSVALEYDYDPATELFRRLSRRLPRPRATHPRGRPQGGRNSSRRGGRLSLRAGMPQVGMAGTGADRAAASPDRRAVPMWLIDANVRGSGKSLLVELVGLIVLGRDAARMSQPSDDDECRKRITSLVMAAETLVLLDNIDRPLGCASLDAVLTSATWSDRVLGENRTFTGRVTMTFAATGNNVGLQADTARRVSYIRLRSPLENPKSERDSGIPTSANTSAPIGPSFSPPSSRWSAPMLLRAVPRPR